jgi:hypothetical protein
VGPSRRRVLPGVTSDAADLGDERPALDLPCGCRRTPARRADATRLGGGVLPLFGTGPVRRPPWRSSPWLAPATTATTTPWPGGGRCGLPFCLAAFVASFTGATPIEVGEAVKALFPELLAYEPNLPWAQIAGIRDRLAHRSFDASHAIVAATVNEDLPELEAAVRRLLRIVGD